MNFVFRNRVSILAFLLLAYSGMTAWLHGFAFREARPFSPGEGSQVWVNRQCDSCHQLYGLGGYLGPDLTHVSAEKGRPFVEAVLRHGMGRMPDLELTEQEIASLCAFLEEISQETPKDLVFSPWGTQRANPTP
jgi:nitric oxide reductase subunit C